MHMKDDQLISSSFTRAKVGLALGGGVVRGFAHLGVISVLEEAGIPIDLISGSSAGSLVGALYCYGLSTREALDQARHLNWLKLISLTFPSQGIFSFNKLERWLDNLIGPIDFADLAKPFAAVATDLNTGERIILNEGKLSPAVRASCSIPGFFEPREINGRVLGDGSLVDSIPVESARMLGADYVIGVDILTPTVREQWGAFGYGIDALEIVFQRTGGGYTQADCLISPYLAGCTYLRFSKVQDLYQRGQQAAREMLPTIRADLGALAVSTYVSS